MIATVDAKKAHEARAGALFLASYQAGVGDPYSKKSGDATTNAMIISSGLSGRFDTISRREMNDLGIILKAAIDRRPDKGEVPEK